MKGTREALSTGLVFAVLGFGGLACSGDSDAGADQASTTTVAASATSAVLDRTSTTEVRTTTTLSPADQKEADARAEIEEVVVNFGEFPYDSTKGEAGIPLQYTTADLRQLLIDNLESHKRSGLIFRAQGEARWVVNAIDIHWNEGKADVAVCFVDDQELLDATTGEVVSVAVEPPSVAEVLMALTPEGWRVTEIATSLADGDPDPEPCNIPDVSSE